MIPISAGITEGVQKFVAEEREVPYWREYVVGFYFLLAVGLVVLGTGILLALTRLGVAGAVFGEEFTPYFYLLAVFVFVS